MIDTTTAQLDYTGKDFTALVEAMLALARERLPEWTDQTDNDPGRVLLELVAHSLDLQLYYVDRLANESYIDTAVEDRSLVHLLRLIGYELRPPRAASADLNLYFDGAAAGTVTVPTGARFETSAKLTGTPVPFQYIRTPLAIPLPSLPLVTIAGVTYRAFTGLPLVQVDSAVIGEVIGTSDATPGQRFRLARSPLVDGTLRVMADEGSGPREYEIRESLLESSAVERHVAVRRDESDVIWVEFGARVPPRIRNGLTASYRVGGGAKGNVPAQSIVTAVTALPDLKKVSNPLPASGGSDREPLAEAVARAPRQYRSQGRAVTAADYESHALAFGVGKARARAAGWNRVELYVAPAGGGFPSDTLKQDLAAYFESRRTLTAIIDVLDPVYPAVEVVGDLEIEPYVFTQQVKTAVQAAVAGLLAFDAVDFGDTLFLSKVYEAIEGVDGVRGVNITRFNLRGDPGPPIPESGRLAFGWNEIPVAAFVDGIQLTTVTGGAA